MGTAITGSATVLIVGTETQPVNEPPGARFGATAGDRVERGMGHGYTGAPRTPRAPAGVGLLPWRSGVATGKAPGRLLALLALATLVTAAMPACTAHRPLTGEETFAAASEHFKSEAYEQAIEEYNDIL